jgi:hypothetical protein
LHPVLLNWAVASLELLSIFARQVFNKATKQVLPNMVNKMDVILEACTISHTLHIYSSPLSLGVNKFTSLALASKWRPTILLRVFHNSLLLNRIATFFKSTQSISTPKCGNFVGIKRSLEDTQCVLVAANNASRTMIST